MSKRAMLLSGKEFKKLHHVDSYQVGAGTSAGNIYYVSHRPTVKQYFSKFSSEDLRVLKEQLKDELRTELKSTAEHLIVLTPTTRKEAKDKIIALIKSKEGLYYSDIAQKLGLDLEVAVGLCSELEREGSIRAF